MKADWKTAFAYWFVHLSVEVMCFYTLFKVFKGGAYWWTIGIMFDTLAFAPQAIYGHICEKYPRFRPGITGALIMAAGSAIMLICAGVMTGCISTGETLTPALVQAAPDQLRLLIAELFGLLLLTVGNGLIHISGALATLRVSEGRLSESAVFVGGGSFGVIGGRLLAGVENAYFIPFLLVFAAIILMIVTDRRIRSGRFSGYKAGLGDAFDFSADPCKQAITADRPAAVIITVLALVVVIRAYIGYGIPTAWNQTVVQTVSLFLFMGAGKMLGGILSDMFGARRVGVISCLLAIPLLIGGDNIIWLSLPGVSLFSMTMAITLGGLVSVLNKKPGTAFGITTIGLLLGSLPVFIFGLPTQLVCNILITVMSILAATGLLYTLKKT